METKPVVTCYGDNSLFSGLQPLINRGLPQEATEWRRSYGRPAKFVRLEVSFVPYDDDILPTENEKTLISRPFFHIYWTECDLDNYKQSVKEDMAEWHAALKNNNIPDWLIVVVVSDESKVKSKLLPRSSVIDKVKSDFCGKQVDRCIVLTEPLKGDQKCLDSWNNFYQRLRQLLLQSFNKHLNKYEENMRSLRERRNEHNWSFSEYFLVQEELAFMFEMLGIYDDSLLQYDELDALFTQFLLNHAAGETVDWLTPFVEPCTTWAGISLTKALNWEKRDLIKQNKASLLEFRNYLFSRQCALLSLLNRPWEIAERAVAYLHNTVQEMKTLEIQLPEGSLACWVFLSCLEVLQTSEKLNDTNQSNAHSLYTASLWDYARRKLKELGFLCGLMPGLDSKPTSEQLSKVVDLLFGMGVNDEDATGIGPPRPIDRLREALSSKESFKQHYLELSELAMGTFKHIGRVRSARIIGHDLAEFYMKLGEPLKAEGFLLDAMKMYKQEGWDILADGVRILVAQCQKKLDNTLKYIKTCCHIACSSYLTLSERCHYLEELYQLTNNSDSPFYLKTHPAFITEDIILNTPVATFRDEMSVTLEIRNNFPQDITVDFISLGFSYEITASSRSIENISLKPGLNSVTLKCQVQNCKKGLYKMGQLCIKTKQMEFIRHNVAHDVFIEIFCQQPYIEITPSPEIGQLVSGIRQEVEVTFHTSSIPILANNILRVTTSDGLSVSNGKDEETNIPLPATPANDLFTFKLFLQHVLTKDQVEGTVTFDGDFLHSPISCQIVFYPPLAFSHRLYSCKERKYIQVEVKGSNRIPFLVSTPQLKAVENNDVEFIPLGYTSKWQEIHCEQSTCFMWQLRSNAIPMPSSLDLTFTVTYRTMADEDDLSRLSVYNIHMINLQTLYIITSTILPGNDQKQCKVGTVCHLDFCVTTTSKSESANNTQLLYEVVVDHLLWAVCGKVTGVFSLNDSKFKGQLQVIPLMPGFLPLPLISLSKYKPKDGQTYSASDKDTVNECIQLANEKFDVGQVYNSSLGKQVHVYSEQGSGNIETIITY
ncbi:TRAPPC10 [Acanthosepion pharaonis]|uniref:TRAPPC10 n=1 Tax=Acanthosepion pharaonis TaxID=158019 RepID=A0A812CK48_ACAPH|nr:TRAPPC10 [Sepia pharaonis]